MSGPGYFRRQYHNGGNGKDAGRQIDRGNAAEEEYSHCDCQPGVRARDAGIGGSLGRDFVEGDG